MLRVTGEQFKVAYRRAYTHGLRLTGLPARAHEVARAAMRDAVDPHGDPWTAHSGKTLSQFACDRVSAILGSAIQSYEWLYAAAAEDEEPEGAAPPAWVPEEDLLAQKMQALARRRNARVRSRLKDDPLVELLLDAEGAPRPPPRRGGGRGRPKGTVSPGTRLAHEAGYNDKEIKNARERLKRHLLAVAREEPET
jgi:hypothetical protein